MIGRLLVFVEPVRRHLAVDLHRRGESGDAIITRRAQPGSDFRGDIHYGFGSWRRAVNKTRRATFTTASSTMLPSSSVAAPRPAAWAAS